MQGSVADHGPVAEQQRHGRRQLIDAAQFMNQTGINQGTAGNLSLRMDDGMLITPSGLEYSSLKAPDIVHVAMNGEATGNRPPSSEWRIHRDIYQARGDAQAIVHAHPSQCVSLASLRRPIPAFHYMVAVAGGKDIRCAGYATFGTQALSDLVVEALEDRKACLMANHGLICLDSSLDRALSMAVEIEHLAGAYCRSLALGEPVILSDEEMNRVVQKFNNYGANSTADPSLSKKGAGP